VRVKADLISLDAARAERGYRNAVAPGSEAARTPGKVMAMFVGAILTALASGFVAAALWFAWILAEILQ
jgi:hypothetical protein